MIQPFIQNLFNSTLQMGEGENPQQIFTEQQGEDFQTLLANIGASEAFEAQKSDTSLSITSPTTMLNMIPLQQKPDFTSEVLQDPKFSVSEALTTLEYSPLPTITIDDFIIDPEEIIIHDIKDQKYEEDEHAIAAITIAPVFIEPAAVITADIKDVPATSPQFMKPTEYTTTAQLTEQLSHNDLPELTQPQFIPNEKVPESTYKGTENNGANLPQFQEILEQSLSENAPKDGRALELQKVPVRNSEKIENKDIQKGDYPILEKPPIKISDEVQISVLPEAEQFIDQPKQESSEITHLTDGVHATEKPIPKAVDSTQVKQQIIEKVQVSVQKFRIAPKIETLRFQLTPKELGSIDISFHLKANNLVSIEIKAEKKETLEAIQNASSEIKAIASEARMSVSDVELSFDLKDMTHDEPKKHQQAQKNLTYEQYVKRDELDREDELNIRAINTDNPISILI